MAEFGAGHVNTVPVIPGFWSDPTVCRGAEGQFVLANSSFEYFPGAPVHVSDDMLQWRHVGNVITRPEQADLTSGVGSSGIFGSTIRYHDGRYWFITTNIAQVLQGQLLFHAEKPEGPWSDGVFVKGLVGIDPDIAWDDSGTCYVTWCGFPGGIQQVTINPETGEVLSEPVKLWNGTGMRNPEGPHIYPIGDWWYLLIAEGGTGHGHSVSVARSRDPQGPYEPYEHNPILTHRSTDHPVQSTGHGDLVEGPGGQWYIAFHGTRPKGQFPEFHLLGRETFVAPVEWVDGWPTVVEADLDVRAVTSFSEDFTGDLAHRWVVPGGSLAGVETTSEGLQLTATDGSGLPVVTRVQDHDWTATATIDTSRGDSRLLVRLDGNHWYGVETSGSTVQAVAQIGPVTQVLATREAAGPEVTLTISVRPPTPAPGWPPRQSDVVSLDGLVELDGRYVATEVAGGFTGRMLGIQALNGAVSVRSFVYDGRDGIES